MTLADILDLFRYNAWANARITSSITALPSDALTQDLGGSFLTIRDTFAHVISAEWIWLERWRGVNPTSAPDWVKSVDLSHLGHQLNDVETRRTLFLAGLSEPDLNLICSYTLLSGKPSSNTLQDLFVHVTNHSTYHRGQIATMLRRLGTPAASTDFLIYRSEGHP
jgi:uncharacterized damage-inducible protein DinB